MVRITFLGTKGENEFSNRFHHGHTAWLLESGKTRLLFDFGKNHAGQYKDVKPTAIVISHAHPDHVEGLKDETVGVPVYMSRVTDGLLKQGYEGLEDRRILLEAKPMTVADGITLTAFHTRHSSKAPSVAIKIETPEGTIGWVSDVISVMLGKQFFKSLELYIGDASYFHGGMVRTIRGELVGHTAVTTQLGWLGKHGVKQAIFSHFGDWIYQAGERRAREMLHEAAPGVIIYLARDGAVFHLRQGRVELGQGRTKGMSITDTLSELAEKARSVARSIEAVTKTEPVKAPKRAIVLASHHAQAVVKGRKTLVVKARLLEAAGQELYLADSKYIYGVVVLSKHKPISTAEFRRRAKEHRISEDERKSMWPLARKLYAYQVVEMHSFENPKPWTPPEASAATEPRFKRPLKDEEVAAFTEGQLKSINGVRVIAEGLLPLVDLFAQRAPKLMPVEQPITELLPRMPWIIKSLIEEFGVVCKQRPTESSVPSMSPGNLFDQAERLVCQLEEVTDFLPKKTRIAGIADDAIEPLRSFASLDAEFVEGDALSPAEPELAAVDLYLEKYEKPRGRLSTLKMPDPAFNVRRLKTEHSTGVLSRLERQGRIGERQFLINELEATKADGQYVWGVITLDKPVKYDDLSKVPEAIREGIDRFSKEEFSTESPIFYMPMQLVAAYEPPLRLKSPVPSRRYGGAITLPDALAKGACGPITSEDVPHQAIRQVAGEGPSMTWRGITPDKLQELPNDELKNLLAEVERLIRTEFTEGKTSIGGGVSLEDATNARRFIANEMSRRGLALACEAACEPTTKAGPSEQYAPCRGSGAELGKEIALEDILPKFHDEFLLRAPFIHLCGGVVNNGATKNDLDVLIKGPLDPVTFHVAKFRLARMLPPELAERLQFHGDGAAEGDVSAAGPFSAHIPLYDLVVRRREDSQAIIEMRDAGLLIDPTEVLLAKADPNLKLPAKEDTFPGVVQAHIRGASIHADFRVKQGDYLIGYTLSIQIPKTVPEFNSLAEAKAFVKDFSRDGSSWNKPLVAPARVYAAPKAPEPEEWLRINAEEFAPGTVGATRFKKGYMIALAHPTVSRGKTEPYFQEYFCERDPKFYGLLNFRLLVSDAGKPGDPEVEAGRQMPQGATFITAMFTKSLLPSMLKKRAVDTGSIPPQGWAFLPPGLKAVVPKQFQYWHAKDEKERLGIRDALVAEGFFNESNIKIVDYEFRRVVTKYYLCDTDKGSDSIAYKHQPSPPADQLTGPAEVSQEKDEVVEAEKGLSKAPFTLSWQRWKGQVVVRAAPSRQLFHLLVQRAPNELEDFQLMDDPTGGGPITAIHKVIRSTEAGKLMSYEGEVPPGEEVAGVVLNDTKGTPSTMSILHRGEIDFLQDDRAFKKFRFKGKGLPKSLEGELVLRAEKGEGDIWIYEQSKQVGEPIARAEEVELEKKERIKTMPLADGKQLADVQVWDPKDISPDDDKTHDRERLRPLAFYKPMKVAPRASNEFRSSDMDRLFKDFATEELLKTGLIVEPKWNGFRASVQKDDKGRQLMISEDIWDRKTPVSNFLDHLPGLKEELDKLPGPYILDGEFMAVTSEGDPVPRRELADFRSTSAADDVNVRVHVFDILFSPTKGNVMAQPARERHDALQVLLKGHKLSRLVLTPQRVVHSKPELLAAIEWARAIPGSEGAMLKSVESTVTLRETDSMAKLKMIREIRGIIWDAHPVKDSPGVHNFMYAVGPVSAEEAKTFTETVEIEGKTYVKAGKSIAPWRRTWIRRNGLIELVSFEESWESCSTPVEVSPSGCELRAANFETLSVANGCLQWTKVSEVSRHPFSGDLLRVDQEVGSTVVTGEHSLIDEDMCVCRADAFAGRRVFWAGALPWPNACEGASQVNLRDLVPGAFEVRGCRLPEILEGDALRQVCYWWGRYLADGCSGQYQYGSGALASHVIVVKNSREIQERTQRALLALGLGEATWRKQDRTWHLVKNSQPLHHLVKSLSGCSAHEKRVPSFVYNLAEVFRDAFIQGALDDGDGGREGSRRYFGGVSSLSVQGMAGLLWMSDRAGISVRPSHQGTALRVRERLGVQAQRRSAEMTPIPYSGFVYDFTVPGSENFVDAEGGLLLHNTFNTKLNARVGDVVRIEVTELLFDSSNPEKKRLRGFTPTVIDRVSQPPSNIKEVLELLDPGELKKSEAEARAGLAKNAGRRFDILKQSADEEQYVFGVVLEPETFDSQGDIYDPETVRQAAYHFMRKQHILGYMHESLLANAQYEVLENYLAPVAFELEGQPVKKGTWLLGAHIVDPKLWEDIKAGRLTGWSIEGTALVEEIR